MIPVSALRSIAIRVAVTCNHIHLLAVDSAKEVISKSMQLLSGTTGQAYNTRKNRKGAFWEDRFYTTAIESGVHLLRCMAYKEAQSVYNADYTPENWTLRGENAVFWDDFFCNNKWVAEIYQGRPR